MKRFLVCLSAMLLFAATSVFAQELTPEPTSDVVYENMFLTFSALAGGVVLVVEGVKKAFVLSGFATQLVSWLTGIAFCFFGWWFGLGFLTGLEWYIVLAYGLGISLASNGIADTGFLQWIINLFIRKKTA